MPDRVLRIPGSFVRRWLVRRWVSRSSTVCGPGWFTCRSSLGQPVFARPVALAAKDASTPIEPGTADVTADVTVTFTIR